MKKPAAKKTAAKPAKAKAAKKPMKPAAKKRAVAKKSAKPAAKAKAVAKPVAKVAGVAIAKVKVANQGKTDVSSVFSPLDDRVIVEEVKTELRTAGGLFIPDTVADPSGPKEGVVLAVGRGHLDRKGRMRPLDVKKGDTVLFETYMGDPLKIGDRDVTVLRESLLLGVKND
jgi:chaperonin GroES